jgi:Flp pilus assembly pilin Flp
MDFGLIAVIVSVIVVVAAGVTVSLTVINALRGQDE